MTFQACEWKCNAKLKQFCIPSGQTVPERSTSSTASMFVWCLDLYVIDFIDASRFTVCHVQSLRFETQPGTLSTLASRASGPGESHADTAMICRDGLPLVHITRAHDIT